MESAVLSRHHTPHVVKHRPLGYEVKRGREWSRSNIFNTIQKFLVPKNGPNGNSTVGTFFLGPPNGLIKPCGRAATPHPGRHRPRHRPSSAEFQAQASERCARPGESWHLLYDAIRKYCIYVLMYYGNLWYPSSWHDFSWFMVERELEERFPMDCPFHG